MRKTLGLAAMLLLLTVGTAQAVQLFTPGDASCGAWASEKKSGSTHYLESWLFGYLSGMAAATSGIAVLNDGHTSEANGDLLKGNSPQSASLWMDTYCQMHPLDQIDRGAIMLIVEYSKRKQSHETP